jgi:hypothetical protein
MLNPPFVVKSEISSKDCLYQGKPVSNMLRSLLGSVLLIPTLLTSVAQGQGSSATDLLALFPNCAVSAIYPVSRTMVVEHRN